MTPHEEAERMAKEILGLFGYTSTDWPATTATVYNLIEPILAEVQRMKEAQAWWTMDSAPKDGSIVLYWPAVAELGLTEHIAICDHRGGPYRHPTHWFPLPSPPEASK